MLLSHIEILDGELWVLSALTDALSDEQTISDSASSEQS